MLSKRKICTFQLKKKTTLASNLIKFSLCVSPELVKLKSLISFPALDFYVNVSDTQLRNIYTKIIQF